MERAVGWFVMLATGLLVFGFAYYVYNTAKRKGWFTTRAPYFTMIDAATGLKVGDPVILMGFEAGQITVVKPMPPWDAFNVYVEFEIKDPNIGYLWTVGSRAKVVTADLLGKRVLEVTKGTGGHATYMFYPLRELSLAEAGTLAAPAKWKLAEDLYLEEGTNLTLVMPAMTALLQTNVQRISALGRREILAFDTREERKTATAVWNDQTGRYETFTTNLYWLPSDESPAVTERLERLLSQVEKALPDFLSLTNQLGTVLGNSVNLTSNLNLLAGEARPAATNLASLSAQLRGPGALGEWMLGTNGQLQLDAALANANTAIVHTDTNLTLLVENLARSLDNLADITSNLNVQVQSNTNILGEISSAVINADDLVQGLKRHWLLRSAFKGKTNAPATPPATPPRYQSPKMQGR